MRRSWLKPATILPALLTPLALGCGGDDGGGNVEPTPVTSVTVTAPRNTIAMGETVQLTATARDSRNQLVPGQTFEWSSSNEAVASVTPASALVTGLAEGSAEITATTNGIAGTITIGVTGGTGPPRPANLGLATVVSGLDFPTNLVSPPNDPRLFVTEKAGVIRVIKDGAVLPEPFLDLTGQVASQGGEQGLIGLVFTPDYATSGRFFVHYTAAPSGESHISSFRVSADPDRADPASETVVLSVSRPGTAHNGGQLQFGRDGFLYIGLGDGDDRDGGRGQSLSDPLGSILRIDVSGPTGYVVPPDNPFVATAGARPEVWSYGLRNPWRFSFDRTTGDLYVGDVGESDREEVNYSSAAEGAGKGINYGWAIMEGTRCVRGSTCEQTGLVRPVMEYAHPVGCSVISGYVYRGAAIPGLQGAYFFADFCGGWVKSFRIEDIPATFTDWPSLEPGGFITSFGEDAAGELYVTTEEGGVHKIVQR